MTVVSAVRLHLEQLTNANYRSLPRGGGGLGKANATFAFKNRHNLDVVPYAVNRKITPLMKITFSQFNQILSITKPL